MSKIKSALFLVSLIFGFTLNAKAEILTPIQIMLPGNIQGNLITFSSDQKAESSEAFKLPYVIKAFQKEKGKKSLIFGLGNDSSLFKAFSYLNKGKAERQLIERCQILAGAVSPNDLEVFNDTFLDNIIKNRVFTNIEAPDYKAIFQRCFISELGNHKLYFFNFVSSEYCSKLPLERWSEIYIDDPARSIRKLNPQLEKNDFSLSVVYGNQTTVDAIIEELNSLNGVHFLVQIPCNKEQNLFPTTNLENKKGKVFCFSVEPGHNVLPILNIIPKNSGYPRTTLRMIPLKKYTEHAVKNDFKTAWQEVRQQFHEPLKVIPTTNRATTSANRIRLQAHAEMIKYATTSEIAFLKLPDQISFTESVMTVGDTITRFPNERIVRFKATENQIKNMFSEMLRDGSIKEFGFAGCQFNHLGWQFLNFSVNRHTVDKNRLYTVATTESTANEFTVKNTLKSCIIEPYNGLTLWTIWKDNLKYFPANEEKLFE